MSLIFTPTGVIDTARPRIALPMEYLRMLAVLADTSSEIDLGLHCSRCHQNVSGHNAREQNQWEMACGCRTFYGGNPTPTEAA